MNPAASHSLQMARMDYAIARNETLDNGARYRAHMSAGMHILDAAKADPEDPKVKKAMQAIMNGQKGQHEG